MRLVSIHGALTVGFLITIGVLACSFGPDVYDGPDPPVQPADDAGGSGDDAGGSGDDSAGDDDSPGDDSPGDDSPGDDSGDDGGGATD